MALEFPELFVILWIVVVCGLLLVWPAARLCRRIGFSSWLGLLAAVPIANVVLLWFVAFAPWPGLPDSSPHIPRS